MDYVPYAVPFFLLAILIELAYGISKKNNTYRLMMPLAAFLWAHYVLQINLLLLVLVAISFTSLRHTTVYGEWMRPHR
jgi:hypothetical protein